MDVLSDKLAPSPEAQAHRAQASTHSSLTGKILTRIRRPRGAKKHTEKQSHDYVGKFAFGLTALFLSFVTRKSVEEVVYKPKYFTVLGRVLHAFLGLMSSVLMVLSFTEVNSQIRNRRLRKRIDEEDPAYN